MQDSNVETVILISPKFGISQINSLRNSVVSKKTKNQFIYCFYLFFFAGKLVKRDGHRPLLVRDTFKRLEMSLWSNKFVYEREKVFFLKKNN